MTKREFDRFITESLKDLPLEKQEILLSKMLEWTRQSVEKFEQRMKKSYVKCSKCGKYLMKIRLTVVNENILECKCIYSDAGYGYDDVFADVTYNVESYICPYCGEKIEKNRYELSESNKRNRWGEKL